MLTSQHLPKDVRIYERETLSLIKGGHKVTIVYMGDKALADEENVVWVAIPKPSNRFLRVLSGWKIAGAARRISNADIFIIHDAEILYLALMLRLTTAARIVYDCHESTPHFIADKKWVPPFLKGIAHWLVLIYEWFFSLFCDGVITVYDKVNERFSRWGRNTIMVRNFPPAINLSIQEWKKRPPKIIYVGLFSQKRRIDRISAIAAALPEWQVEIWGPTYEQHYIENVLGKYAHLSNLSVHIGRIPYSKAMRKMVDAKFGMVLLSLHSAHQHTLSSKIFDYMMVGTIPIATNTEPNTQYLGNGKYGFLVSDESGGEDIANLISEKMNDTDVLEKMSEECRKKALNDYCWENEAETLRKFIEKIEKRRE